MASLFGMTLNSLPAWLGGGGPTKANIPPLQGQPYPSQDDVAFARANDASYGSNAAAFVQPPYGGQVASPNTLDKLTGAFQALEDSGQNPVKPAAVSPAVSDNLMQGYLASQRSALAALGYDPRRMVIGDVPPEEYTYNGSYYPDQDQILSTGVHPATTTHESMHRGMEMLRQAGMLPSNAQRLDEESIIRGQMLRNYGGVEKGNSDPQQIKHGEFYNSMFPDTMDAIETAAQKLYAQRHPRGPR